MSIPNVSKDTELRHLPIQIQLQLVKLLDVDDSVLSLLMGNIVKNLEDGESELRFNSKHIDAIREHSQRHNKSAILVLLDEWSTMGRLRPKVGHFLDLLIKCELFQAADYLADLLNENKPERPSSGPAASVDISILNNIDEIVNDLNYPFSSIDLTTKANRINNFVKPDIHTPNMNHYMNNVLENGTATGQSKIFNQLEMSDLMKFSKTMTTQLVPTTIDSLDSQNVSAAIPLTVNSAEQRESSNFPALSGLMMTSKSTLQSSSTEEQLPVFLQSMGSKSESHVPDFSGLMNQSTAYESSSSDQSQSSITESSINTTIS